MAQKKREKNERKKEGKKERKEERKNRKKSEFNHQREMFFIEHQFIQTENFTHKNIHTYVCV